MENEELWQAVLAQIQFHISRANFATWFKNTSIVSRQEGKIAISVPNSFSKEWFEAKYNKDILKILSSLGENVKEIKYITTSGLKIQTPREPHFQNGINSQVAFPELEPDEETNLNPRYQFSNFIVGSFNELANAAVLAVAKNPGLAYNPLFIYGGVGLGKTHLIQALGNDILAKHEGKKIKYLPSEKYISATIKAIQNKSIEKLKTAYRQNDVLIIDDVQFLAGKEKCQEEFFHLFNTLYQKNKQIIISSDRPPKAIQDLEERLRSRFEGGMVADIGLPDFETRIAILKTKAEEKKINLPDSVYEYIATNITRNIRELEGALNRLIAYSNLQNKVPDLEVAKTLLRSDLLAAQKTTSPKKY